MKNYLVMGFCALVLFAISAGLSIWLNQPHSTESESPKKGAAKEPERDRGRAAEPARSADTPTEEPRPGTLRDSALALRDREARLERRQAQIEIILQDIRATRDSIDDLRKQVQTELKLSEAKAAEVQNRVNDLKEQKRAVDRNLADLQKRQVDLESGERKNIDKMASMYDSMPAENAAKILQQMADSGKLDTAVKLLASMKERQAARVLAELPDTALAAQLLDKMRGLKRAPPPPVTGTPETAGPMIP